MQVVMQLVCRLLCSWYAGCYAVGMQEKGGLPMHACITNPDRCAFQNQGSGHGQDGHASLLVILGNPFPMRNSLLILFLAPAGTCHHRGRGGLGVVMSSVDAKIVEPESLGDAVKPVLFRDLVAGIVLGGADLQGFQLCQG